MSRLTKRIIDEAKPSDKPFFVWDNELPGFALLVLPSGVKTFILQYRNAAHRSRRLTIGRFGVITADTARSMAREALVEVTKGGDPAEDRQASRKAPSMNDLFDRYIEEHVHVRNKPSTQRDVLALVKTHLRPRIGTIHVSDFNRADVARVHHAMKTTPRQANYALAVLSKALSLAEVWGMRPENTNPCGTITRYPENHRKRFLRAEEVERLGEALHEAETIGLPWQLDKEIAHSKHLAKEANRRTRLSWQVIAAVRLLLLTGARLSEVIGLKWSDIDQEAQTMAFPDKKGGKREPHPVSTMALAILADLPRIPTSEYVLPRPDNPERHISREVMENAWQRLRSHLGIEDVRLHDLRHTVGTYAAQAGVSAFIVRDLLRHKNITTTSRYANFDANPVRHISNLVGERISAGLTGEKTAEKANKSPTPYPSVQYINSGLIDLKFTPFSTPNFLDKT